VKFFTFDKKINVLSSSVFIEKIDYLRLFYLFFLLYHTILRKSSEKKKKIRKNRIFLQFS
jgi:hypothetical protein